MVAEKNQKKQNISPTSLSSIETQRQLRIDKLRLIEKSGFSPYAITSQRDFVLLFVKFWFHWSQKTQFEEVAKEIAPVTMDYFLHQILFPKNLLEQAEEMIQIRQALKSMGLDPDDERFRGNGIPEKIIEYRSLFPMIHEVSNTQKYELLTHYLRTQVDKETGHKTFQPALQPHQKITVSGRVGSKRGSGKISFISLQDESLPSGFQCILRSDLLPDTQTHKITSDNFTQTSLQGLFSGKKTIETLPLSSKILAHAATDDRVEIYDDTTKTRKVFRIRDIQMFPSLIEAYSNNVDFHQVLPDLPDIYTFGQLRSAYETHMSKEMLLELEKGIRIFYLVESELTMSFTQLKEYIDEGDYLQITGKLEYSKTGEPSIMCEAYHILTKALRPLPESIEYNNLEYRYLNRVADFKLNTRDPNTVGIRDYMYKKSRYWNIWREELYSLGFLDVECPIFEHIPGGAEAKPFTTFYEALDQEMYMRISLELPLKKLIAGGFEKVFEIGRIFRNEGVSPQHLQEYTQLEFYWSYADYIDCMHFIQRVYRRQIKELTGSLTTVDYLGNSINWGESSNKSSNDNKKSPMLGGWPMMSFYEAVRKYSNGKADIENKNQEELIQHAHELGVALQPGDSKARIMDLIWKKTARPQVIDPIFLILPPVELEPLAKRDPLNPHLTQRFQVVAGAAELGKGFTELNDPLDQRARFEEQQAARDAGDEEAQFMDESYLEAMEYGMPPLTGFGISERFFSFIMGKPIKELVTFPAVRKEENDSIKPLN